MFSEITEIELESLTDVNMILDCENRIRANNKYMYDYDETNESSYFAYVAFNIQNKWDLSEPLPFGRFENVEKYINYERYNNFYI